MNNFFEDLKQYFDSTPQHAVEEAWKKTEAFDEIGPTVEEFLKNTQQYVIQTDNPKEEFEYNINNNLNPNFASGFILHTKTNNNAKSCFFYN
jgi:hypothetical protein